eukprot:GEMP01013692.1.p1 GENE.GEMP01013692.1~~GEMP01013692.1.p1  ORF type:complete len:554 (+),score=122.95 GEMP01013692.1:173-1834(+)
MLSSRALERHNAINNRAAGAPHTVSLASSARARLTDQCGDPSKPAHKLKNDGSQSARLQTHGAFDFVRMSKNPMARTSRRLQLQDKTLRMSFVKLQQESFFAASSGDPFHERSKCCRRSIPGSPSQQRGHRLWTEENELHATPREEVAELKRAPPPFAVGNTFDLASSYSTSVSGGVFEDVRAADHESRDGRAEVAPSWHSEMHPDHHILRSSTRFKDYAYPSPPTPRTPTGPPHWWSPPEAGNHPQFPVSPARTTYMLTRQPSRTTMTRKTHTSVQDEENVRRTPTNNAWKDAKRLPDEKGNTGERATTAQKNGTRVSEDKALTQQHLAQRDRRSTTSSGDAQPFSRPMPALSLRAAGPPPVTKTKLGSKASSRKQGSQRMYAADEFVSNTPQSIRSTVQSALRSSRSECSISSSASYTSLIDGEPFGQMTANKYREEHHNHLYRASMGCDVDGIARRRKFQSTSARASPVSPQNDKIWRDNDQGSLRASSASSVARHDSLAPHMRASVDNVLAFTGPLIGESRASFHRKYVKYVGIDGCIQRNMANFCLNR